MKIIIRQLITSLATNWQNGDKDMQILPAKTKATRQERNNDFFVAKKKKSALHDAGGGGGSGIVGVGVCLTSYLTLRE